MLQLRQFDLQFAFARARALRKNVQNQRRAVQDFAVENLFQVAALGGRQFIVKNDRVHALFVLQNCENSSALPLPMNVAAIQRFHFLDAFADHFRAGGLGQFGQFRQRLADVRRALCDLSSTPDEKNFFQPRSFDFDE